MKSIIVGFSRPIKWKLASWAIMAWCRAPFSHAYFKFWSQSYNRSLVYQASHGMVHFVAGSNFSNSNRIESEYELQVSEEQYSSIMIKCIDLAGIKYGFWTLVGMAFERITGLKSPFRDQGKSFICSELVGELLRLCGEDLIDIDLELAGPRELEACVAKLPGVMKIK